MRPDTAGWFIFDGNYTLIDGPFDTLGDAETAATSHRATDSDLNTVVGYGEPCYCHPDHGCFFSCVKTGGLVMDQWQEWRESPDMTVAAV